MRKAQSTNRLNEVAITSHCPITSTMMLIGGRWKLVILWHLRDGMLRYNEIRKAIPLITEKMLIQQLKELMESKLVEKKDYQEIPPRTAYYLSDLGLSLIPVLDTIFQWGSQHQATELVRQAGE